MTDQPTLRLRRTGPRRLTPLLAFLPLLALCSRPIGAETVTLRSGEILSGQIGGASAEGLSIRVDGHALVVEWDFFVPDVAVALWEPRIARTDAEGTFAFAEFASRAGIAEKARTACERVLELSPDHAGARAALGYVKEGGRWVKPEEKSTAVNTAGIDNTKAGADVPERAQDFDRKGWAFLEAARKQRGDAIDTVEKAVDQFKKATQAWSKFSVAWYHLGIVYQFTKEFDDAEKALKKALALNPEFHEAMVELGDVYHWMRDDKKALAEYDRALALNPNYAHGYANKSLVLLQQRKLKEAREAVDAAKKFDPQDIEIKSLDALVVQEEKGTGWATVYQKKTKHFDVQSNDSQETADFISEHAEIIYNTYSIIFPKADHSDEPCLPIYVYATAEQYFATGAPRGTGGYFHPLLKKSLFYRQADEKNTLIVLYHELFHHFLDMYFDDAPQWFNEGHGDYFGPSVWNPKDRKMYIKVNPWRLPVIQQAIRTGTYTPIAKLLQMTQDEMYDPRTIGVNYAEAWSFVYFLWEYKGAKYANLMRAYFQAMQKGMGLRRAYEAAFGRTDMKTLEKEWKDYMLGLEAGK
ncbi:MAG: tetratricopeptide repeat protein [Planctomycetes bacterium]|nr:tetratricopeptide repeat protein [Planctomycetota bacterium]